MALALPSFVRSFNEELGREWEVSRDGPVVHQRTDGRPDAEDLGTEKAAVLALCRRLVLEHLDDGFGLEGAELGISFNDATARLLPLLTKKAKRVKRLTRLELLGEFREVAHVLAAIPHVGIGVSMEGAQFSRLRSLIPGLERVPTAAR